MSLKFALCLLFLALYCGWTVAKSVPKSSQNFGVLQLEEHLYEDQEEPENQLTASGRQLGFYPDWRYCKFTFGVYWCPIMPGYPPPSNPPTTTSTTPPTNPSAGEEAAQPGEEEQIDPTNPGNLPASVHFQFPGFLPPGHHHPYHYAGYHNPGYHYPRPTEKSTRPTRPTTTTTTAKPENCKTIKHLGYTLCIKSNEATT
ncbi:hypothetical protein ACLKA6_015726 [Drosophila palustris]